MVICNNSQKGEHVGYRCLLIDGPDFDLMLNHVLLQQYKNKLEIIGVLTKYLNIEKIAGYPAYTSKTLNKVNFDYAIVMDISNFNLSISDLQNYCGIDKDKIIGISAFREPDFDFDEYILLKTNPVTIVSDLCFGGIAYNFLGLPFTSPFINMYLSEEDTIKLAKNLKYYLNKPLKLVRYQNSTTGNKYPICSIGDVELGMNHYSSYEEAEAFWKRRVKRINYSNLIFVMHFEKPSEYYEEFLKLPVKKIVNVGFDPGKEKVPHYLYEIKADFLQYSGLEPINNGQGKYNCNASQSLSLVKALLGKPSHRRELSGVPTIDLDVQKGIKNLGSECLSLLQYYIVNGLDDSEEYDQILQDVLHSNPSICLSMGRLYRDGVGFNKDYQKAVYWYKLAVQHNVSRSLVEYMDLLWKEGSKESLHELITIAKMDQYASNGYIQGILAKAYREGKGVKQDLGMAAKYMEIALNLGVWYAPEQLCDILWKIGTPESLEKMINIASKEIYQDKKAIQGVLGKAYRDGKGVPQDYMLAAEHMRKAFNLGLWYAPEQLCDILWKIGTPESLSEMVKIANMPAYSNNGYIMGLMGKAYRDGKGVDRDLTKSVNYLRKAKSLGVWFASSELCTTLWLAGTPESIEEFWKLSADPSISSYPQIQLLIGEAYLAGIGTKKDLDKARYYFEKAASNGSKSAKTRLNQF